MSSDPIDPTGTTTGNDAADENDAAPEAGKTDHPTGADQAAENEENEPAS